MKPYSENIIFMDAEFTDLNARTGELISIALVKPNGKKLYLELEYSGEVHPWVKKNVLPYLTEKKKYSKQVAAQKIRQFIGEKEPYLIAYVNQFDAIFWYDLFGSAKDHPAYWIPIDFASILFAHGRSPNSPGKHKFYDELGIDRDTYNDHHALDDALLLKEMYERFMNTQSTSKKSFFSTLKRMFT